MSTILISHQGCIGSVRLVVVDLDQLAEVLYVRCLHCKVTPLALLYRTLWREVIIHSPHLKNRELCLTFLGAEYLHI